MEVGESGAEKRENMLSFPSPSFFIVQILSEGHTIQYYIFILTPHSSYHFRLWFVGYELTPWLVFQNERIQASVFLIESSRVT